MRPLFKPVPLAVLGLVLMVVGVVLALTGVLLPVGLVLLAVGFVILVVAIVWFFFGKRRPINPHLRTAPGPR